MVTVLQQGMGRWMEKVLSLGHGVVQSGDTSARHGETAVPDFAAKVVASTTYSSNQDSRPLEKRDVSSPPLSRAFYLLCVV